ncbi:hypothetical protein HELRODRAFT_192702 [Helobdella robusta]|uniref:FANCI solenoid 4 domain-containing protein n=1 Tax=Helobdella robusta TaxID=6412 RepID=T1FU77_HELRO|nr:hypothetical protein HELRODRAFT_192702 [Helobdella robusta]ESO00023.1 hypothetical protein HELRODRAFT_192702 [Helobdella robusta]
MALGRKSWPIPVMIVLFMEVELEKTNAYSSVTVHSSLTITQLLLAGLDEEVDDLHWFIGHLKNKSEERIHDGDLLSTNHDEDATTNVTAASQKKRLPSLIQRVRSVVEVFHEIIQIAFSYGAIMNLITKSLVKFFNFLTSLVKLYIQNYGSSNGDDYTIGGRFEKLIQLIATKLTKSVYPMISYIETVENEHLQAANEKQKNKKNKNANAVDKIKSLKETKAIPNLIYSIEQFEKFLIQLTKKTKINLMCHFKLSTARDFRINSASLQAALDAEEEEEEEERDGDEENNDAGNENIENDNGGSSVNDGDSVNNNGNYGDNNGDKYGRGVPSAAAAADDGGDGCKETQPPSKRMKLKDVLPISNSKKSLKRK